MVDLFNIWPTSLSWISKSTTSFQDDNLCSENSFLGKKEPNCVCVRSFVLIIKQIRLNYQRNWKKWEHTNVLLYSKSCCTHSITSLVHLSLAPLVAPINSPFNLIKCQFPSPILKALLKSLLVVPLFPLFPF